MKSYLRRSILLCLTLSISIFLLAQTTNVYTTSSTFTVPATVTSIIVKVYGGAGGVGGLDCGSGCTHAGSGPVALVMGTFAVAPGNTVGIYPGGTGNNGVDNATAGGGGAGGISTYPSTSFNGGVGGNAGSSGASGGGGGGGGASVVTINSVIKIVAGGAGGGGGMANLASSGQVGSSSTSSNGLNVGGNGTTPTGDGGGGGGGGGGQFASTGGSVHPAGGENAGDGGFLGGSSITGGTVTSTSTSSAFSGRIEITFTSTLPVTWLSFTATRQGNGVALNWSTATEQNTKNYGVERSVNGTDWSDIALVMAAGNSNSIQHYSYIDQSPASDKNYYRIVQRDLDGRMTYSNIIAFSLSGIGDRLKIYPNPVSNGMATVSLKQASTVQVYNSTGVLVMKQQLVAGEHLLNLSQLSKGLYYIKANDDAVSFVVE